MKCLSLKQPYAELLISGRKTIELRKWNTRFRGDFLVHASLVPDSAACKEHGINADALPKGAIVGVANLYGVKQYGSKEQFMADRGKHLAGAEYSSSKYGFLVKDARRLPSPIQYKGRLGFFDVAEAVLAEQ